MRRRLLKTLKQLHGLWPGYLGGTWTLRFDAGPAFAHNAIAALELARTGVERGGPAAECYDRLREALIVAEAKRAGA